VVSEQLAEPLELVSVTYNLQDARPELNVSPNMLVSGLTQEQSITETITLSNPGKADLQQVKLSLLNADRSPAPSWIFVSSANEFDRIGVDQIEDISLNISPGLGVLNNDYRFLFKVTSSNYPDVFIPLDITVSNADSGNVLFHLSDIYTATLDDQGQTILGLKNANISLQNEQVYSQIFDMKSDIDGGAFFTDIPVGSYWYRISAPGHNDQAGRIFVQPNVTKSKEVFVMNQLVTVEWDVQEITLDDRYEITLQATYQTQVPIAVLALEPGNVQLPNMRAGEQFLGELTLTNYGFIIAESMTADFPTGNEFVQFDFLVEVPETLHAGEILTIPYRVTALKDFDPAVDGDITGAGCSTFTEDASVDATSPCANGTDQGVSASAGFSGPPPAPSSGCGGGGGSSWSSNGGGGFGGGGGGSWGGGGSSSSGGETLTPLPGCRDPGNNCGGNGGG
jgi:hypothetical protein